MLNPSLEEILTTYPREEMIEYLTSTPRRFEELISLATKNELPHSGRAAWLLSKIIQENDLRVSPYIPDIIQAFTLVRDGQQRDLIKVLCRIELEEDVEGILFDTSVQIWCHLDHIPSLRYYAFRLILKIIEKHPDLYNELDLLTENHYIDTLSGGIKKSIQKLIKALPKKN